MAIEAVPVDLAEIQALRALFLQESNCQIRYDACHARGWTDSYMLYVNGRAVGYGSVKGQKREDRDTVFEFYVIPAFRKQSRELFVSLLRTSSCRLVECQTNLLLLTSLLHEFATQIRTDTILFKDDSVTEISIAGAIVRPRSEDEAVFEHQDEPAGSHVLEIGGELVASGGFLLHYNKPFADLYMEVRPDVRRRGYGSFLVQEVKRECYLAGRVPAARCNTENLASRATLRKAGLMECGHVLLGQISEFS
jgi:GNAT superfamily N-acetyltransferase